MRAASRCLRCRRGAANDGASIGDVRLGSFFGDPRREIDVVSFHVFGYGRVA
jgi:hypothetical protein